MALLSHFRKRFLNKEGAILTAGREPKMESRVHKTPQVKVLSTTVETSLERDPNDLDNDVSKTILLVRFKPRYQASLKHSLFSN